MGLRFQRCRVGVQRAAPDDGGQFANPPLHNPDTYKSIPHEAEKLEEGFFFPFSLREKGQGMRAIRNSGYFSSL